MKLVEKGHSLLKCFGDSTAILEELGHSFVSVCVCECVSVFVCECECECMFVCVNVCVFENLSPVAIEQTISHTRVQPSTSHVHSCMSCQGCC